MDGAFGVILPAAGSGTRFGSDKLMFDLCGHPVLWHTVSAFQRAESVGAIVIVTRSEQISAVRALTSEFSKVTAVTEGGSTRTESVRKGLSLLPAEMRFVSVHDGARPLIRPEEIDRLHREAEVYRAVCAGVPVYDTVQQVDEEGYITATPDRNRLMAAVTPQIFEREIYERACAADLGDFTDDAGMVRTSGQRVKMIPCRGVNFKITTVEDALRARQILTSVKPDR